MTNDGNWAIARTAGTVENWVSSLCHSQMERLGTEFRQCLLDEVRNSFTELYDAHFARFAARSGRLYARASFRSYPDYIWQRFRVIHDLLESLAADMPDFELEFYLGDGFTGWAASCPSPIFAFSSHGSLDRNVILFPDPATISDAAQLRREVEEGNTRYPWSGKNEIAFWRGSTTGEWMTMENLHRNPRFRLIELSQRFPNEIDARFTGFHSSCAQDVQQRVLAKGQVTGRMSVSDHMQYKYLILVDGFTSPWQRDFWSFHSNSVIIKQKSDIGSWFYPLLKPGIHYVEIAGDLSDLRETVLQIRHDDERARAIVRNANDFAARVLTDSAVISYIRTLLNEYASKFQS